MVEEDWEDLLIQQSSSIFGLRSCILQGALEQADPESAYERHVYAAMRAALAAGESTGVAAAKSDRCSADSRQMYVDEQGSSMGKTDLYSKFKSACRQ